MIMNKARLTQIGRVLPKKVFIERRTGDERKC
jgi:hypothetical protein